MGNQTFLFVYLFNSTTTGEVRTVKLAKEKVPKTKQNKKPENTRKYKNLPVALLALGKIEKKYKKTRKIGQR